MTQALEVKKQTPLQEIRTTLESQEMRNQIKMALPPHIQVEKFIRVVTTAVSNEPKLLNANRRSLYNACMKSAADGLVPDGKEAALVPFGEEVAYMPMVGGILKKVRNSGELKSISAFIVYEKEKFELWVDNDGEHFKHEPIVFGEKGEAIGVYAQAQTKDGGLYFEVMNQEQVMAVRNVAKQKAIWDGPFGKEKWKVACIRRLSKRLPMSTDLEQTIQQIDEEIDLENPAGDEQKPTPAPANTSSRLNAAVGAKTAAPTPTPEPPKPASSLKETQPYKPATPPAAPKPSPVAKAVEEPNEQPLTEAEEQELPI